MRLLLATALLGTLLAAGPAAAAQPPDLYPSRDPDALLQFWYRHFLHRDVDRGGMKVWLNAFRQGVAPDDILSMILGSPEYFQRVGSTQRAFIRQLFLDVTGQEPTGEQMREWLDWSRAHTRREVAQAFLQQAPRPSWLAPADPGDAR